MISELLKKEKERRMEIFKDIERKRIYNNVTQDELCEWMGITKGLYIRMKAGAVSDIYYVVAYKTLQCEPMDGYIW